MVLLFKTDLYSMSSRTLIKTAVVQPVLFGWMLE